MSVFHEAENGEHRAMNIKQKLDAALAAARVRRFRARRAPDGRRVEIFVSKRLADALGIDHNTPPRTILTMLEEFAKIKRRRAARRAPPPPGDTEENC